MYTGSAHQLWEQFRAALWVIFWSALVTFILMKLIGLVLRGARYKDEILEIGDLAIHDEEAFPEETVRRAGRAEAVPSPWPGSRWVPCRHRDRRTVATRRGSGVVGRARTKGTIT